MKKRPGLLVITFLILLTLQLGAKAEDLVDYIIPVEEPISSSSFSKKNIRAMTNNSSDTLGVQNMLVVMAYDSNHFNANNLGLTRAQIVSRIFGNNVRSMNDYFKEVSNNKISFTGKVIDWIAIPDLCNIPQGVEPINYSLSDQLVNKVIAAVDNQEDLRNYQRLLLVLPPKDPNLLGSCLGANFGGASLGGKKTYQSNDGSFRASFSLTEEPASIYLTGHIFEHEIGHALTLAHSGSLRCGSQVIDAPANCTFNFANNSNNTGDRDPFTVMGGNTLETVLSRFHIHGIDKEKLAWLDSNEIIRPPAGPLNQDYTITSRDNNSSNLPKLIKIPRSDGLNYYVEFIQTRNFDQDINGFNTFSYGVIIRIDRSPTDPSKVESVILDFTPGSRSGSEDFYDAVLLPGDVFNDPFDNIQIKNVTQGNSAIVNITGNILSQAPTPSFTADFLHTGETSTFDASASVDPDGTIVSYAWDFGDGNNASGQVVNHSYVNSGLYTVTLTVTDNNGRSSSLSQQYDIRFIPIATFTYSPGFPNWPAVGDLVSFDSTGSGDPDGATASYEWDFDANGSIDSTNPNASFAYQAPGVYFPLLTVRSNNRFRSRNQAIRIGLQDLNAQFSFSANPSTSTAVQFDASSSTADPLEPITRYEWDFNNDGNIDSTLINPSFAFNQAGNYLVKLSVFDRHGYLSTRTRTVTVTGAAQQPQLVAPTANFSFNVSDKTVSFTDQSTDSDGTISSRNWDFGDGNSSTQTSPNHTYTNAGTYTVRLTVTDNDNQSHFVEKQVTATEPASTPNPSPSPNPSPNPNPNPSPNPSPSPNPTPSPAPDPEEEEEPVNQAPQASFTLPVQALIGEQINFDASQSFDSDGSIVSYAWDFDANGSIDSRLSQAQFSYQEPGNYAVTLTVVDDKGAESSLTKSIRILGPFTVNPANADQDSSLATLDIKSRKLVLRLAVTRVDTVSKMRVKARTSKSFRKYLRFKQRGLIKFKAGQDSAELVLRIRKARLKKDAAKLEQDGAILIPIIFEDKASGYFEQSTVKVLI